LVQPGQDLEEQYVPDPHPGPREVVVRVGSAGICRSDVHYRAGFPSAGPLPLTLGHEVAGIVAATGVEVTDLAIGDRVCLHYQVSCGDCRYCVAGNEQFCAAGAMLGKGRDGGYAEQIIVPARNAFRLPDEVSIEHGAVMMCSSATSLHALRKGRLAAGESVAVFGVGGLGMSAIQIAAAFGAATVYAVDIDENRLAAAAGHGAIPVHAGAVDPITKIREVGGVDVALELVGLGATMHQAVSVLRPMGRAVIVGLSEMPLSVAPYEDVILKEAEVIGSADHLAREIPLLLDLAASGKLDLDGVVTDRIPLEPDAVNRAMDRLEEFGAGVRTVIVPG